MTIGSLAAEANAAPVSARESTNKATAYSPARVVHVTSSRFFGGPERQMLELAKELAPSVDTSFVSFSENGLARTFLHEVSRAGFAGRELRHDTPWLAAAARELKQVLTANKASVVCVHGYKAGMLGLRAARQLGIPLIAVSRGWTAESWKVRLYERLDRWALQRMDRVVCVSHGQANKVLRAGVPQHKIDVIHNAIRTERFGRDANPEYRRRLEARFAKRPRWIVGAAGRLSPEKGYDVLVEAAGVIHQKLGDDFGVVLFGEGPLCEELQFKIESLGIGEHFVLAGFTSELDRYMPHFDVFAQSSHTEGLPNVLLEASAAGVPIVATDVGGTSEVIVDGTTGYLVRPNDPQQLATQLNSLLSDSNLQRGMADAGRRLVSENFTFAAQAAEYRQLISSLIQTA